MIRFPFWAAQRWAALSCLQATPARFLFHPRAMADRYDPARVRATYPQPA
jgi:hypothetical protein